MARQKWHEVAEMLERGMTRKEIGDALGVSQSRVFQLVKQVERRTDRGYDHKKDELIELSSAARKQLSSRLIGTIAQLKEAILAGDISVHKKITHPNRIGTLAEVSSVHKDDHEIRWIANYSQKVVDEIEKFAREKMGMDTDGLLETTPIVKPTDHVFIADRLEELAAKIRAGEFAPISFSLKHEIDEIGEDGQMKPAPSSIKTLRFRFNTQS